MVTIFFIFDRQTLFVLELMFNETKDPHFPVQLGSCVPRRQKMRSKKAKRSPMSLRFEIRQSRPTGFVKFFCELREDLKNTLNYCQNPFIPSWIVGSHVHLDSQTCTVLCKLQGSRLIVCGVQVCL